MKEMHKHVRESALMRKSLLGIRVTPFEEEPVLNINEWKIFNAGRVMILAPEDQIKNENYQIERGACERILVRIFLANDKRTIERTKFYYLTKNTDDEIALFLTLALLNRLTYNISPEHELIPFGF